MHARERAPRAGRGSGSHEAVAGALANVGTSNTALGRMADAVAQPIVVLSPGGKAIYANRAALNYLGLSLEQVRADRFREQAFHRDDVERLQESRQNGLAGEPAPAN